MEATRRDLLARDAAEARNARTALTSPSVREDAGKQIAGTISGIAALTNVQQKIQDRVPSYVTRTRVPISEREPPAFVPKGPTYNINAMTTDFGPGFTSGMRNRISQDAFIATGYMPGFVPASKLPLAKVSDQPYGMRTPISPARGQPYGMNISTAVPPREIDAKSPDARRDIDVARLTDRTSFASGVSFRGFPDVSRLSTVKPAAATAPISAREPSGYNGTSGVPADQGSGFSFSKFGDYATSGLSSVYEAFTPDPDSLVGRYLAEDTDPEIGLPRGKKIFTDRILPSETTEDVRMSMTPAAVRPEYVPSSGAYARPERAPALGGIGSIGLSPGYAEKYPSVVAAQTVSRGAYDPANLRAYESLVGPEAYSSIGSEAEKYLASKEADRVAKSDEKVLGVENVPPSPASLQVNTGLSPAEQYFKDIRDVKGVVTKEELASLPEELQKIYMDKQRWERRTDEPYPLTEEQKTAIRAAKIGTSALRKSIIGRAFAGTIRAGAKAVEALAPEGSDLELAARKAAEGGEALMDPGEAMAEYYRADPIEQQRLAEAQRKYREAVGFSWFPESRGERQFVGGGGGMGAVSVSGGGGGADSGGGRPYVYYQWDVGVNIPSPGDPLYTQYQEYLKTKETAPSA